MRARAMRERAASQPTGIRRTCERLGPYLPCVHGKIRDQASKKSGSFNSSYLSLLSYQSCKREETAPPQRIKSENRHARQMSPAWRNLHNTAVLQRQHSSYLVALLTLGRAVVMQIIGSGASKCGRKCGSKCGASANYVECAAIGVQLVQVPWQSLEAYSRSSILGRLPPPRLTVVPSARAPAPTASGRRGTRWAARSTFRCRLAALPCDRPISAEL